ncbi:hypothetical protein PHK61_29965 [Actinomycetospora lutea]|uniref:hypothetical protein n=1 Tax=Actinomycetospora lutea TaxID=663604 RepID=UPI0023666D3A|nr:hypothetical protein [Actinomycetospora lutea]MDD7942647.1 hypothetical protein [Actinomycetospora lutea]
MTSPGGPARASAPAPAAAGTERAAADGTPLRSVPAPGAAPADGPDDDTEDATGAGGDGTEPPDDPPRDATVDDDAGVRDGATGEPAADGWPGQGPDTGTVARSRPSRSPRVGTGVPTPPSPMNATTDPTPGVATGPHPAGAPDPPRRPVPPTFPSPGQPPPGVARRHGRHARPERPGAVHTPPSGYRPRHAAPDAETEQFAATPVTGPGGIGPMPLTAQDDGPAVEAPATEGDADAVAVTADTPIAAAASGGTLLHTSPGLVVPPVADDDGGSDRVRVVLAERRVPTRAVRTVAEIEQQTETGELLLRNLLRAQLALGLRLGLVAVFVLGALPVLFLVFPRFGSFEIAGVTVPWLILGLAPYPFMLALAWLYVRTAERNELDFADNVED